MSIRARSYANTVSGNNRYVPKKTLADTQAEVMMKVNDKYGTSLEMFDEDRISFARTHCTSDNFKRNTAYTMECKTMSIKKAKLEREGYDFYTNVPDKNSKIACLTPEGKESFVRLCTDPYCTYYHNVQFKRVNTICMYDLFGVCKHQQTHHNCIHGSTINDLPSYCIERIENGSYTIFFHHNMVRYYDKHTRTTFVFEFTNKKNECDFFLNITSTLDANERRNRMFKIRDILSMCFNLFITIGKEETYIFPFAKMENNTYISSLPFLFATFIYKMIETNTKFSMFKRSNEQIVGMLIELPNEDLINLVNLSDLEDQCKQALHLLNTHNKIQN